jgi:hypothetical protein
LTCSRIVHGALTGIDGMVVTVRKESVQKFNLVQRILADFIVRTASLPVEAEARVFRLIALDQFPTNPLIMLIVSEQGDIFKVRGPIRNVRDKLGDIIYRVFVIEFKYSEMNQGGE